MKALRRAAAAAALVGAGIVGFPAVAEPASRLPLPTNHRWHKCSKTEAKKIPVTGANVEGDWRYVMHGKTVRKGPVGPIVSQTFCYEKKRR